VANAIALAMRFGHPFTVAFPFLKLPVSVPLLDLAEDLVRPVDGAPEGLTDAGRGRGRGGGLRVGAGRGGLGDGGFVNDGRNWTVTREVEIHSEHDNEKRDDTHGFGRSRGQATSGLWGLFVFFFIFVFIPPAERKMRMKMRKKMMRSSR
jgi:hypothetical protein